MEELSEREDIVINKADKVGAVVIVVVKEYIKEAEQQLNNTSNYKKLQVDPKNYTTERFKKQKLINQKVFEGLERNDLKTLKSYLRSKR